MSDSASDIAPGTRVGPYTVRRPLGKGGHARVYVATDRNGREFAVKVRRRGQDALDRRFLREFESMRLLRLPGVVQVHEAGIEDNYLWFSMDVVRGQPFLKVLLSEPDPDKRIRMVIERGRELLLILCRLHDAGFVHRDVKPSNVLISDEGHVSVLDFGIGRYFSTSDTLSQSGEILGTVPYMAPEQLAGLPIDAKIDIFAAATMLWECLCGKRPKPVTTIGWIPRICLDRLQPLAIRYREVPLALSSLIEDMLAVDPVDRPDASEAVTRFEALLDGTAPPVWPTPPFADPGDWWTPVEAALGRQGARSSVWILSGEHGSGRRRIAEQIHRTGLMSGVWPIHLHCRIDAVGAPVLQFIQRVTRALDEASLSRVIGQEGEMLRRMWPHLPLDVGEGSEPPSTGEVAAAVTKVVRRCADHHPLLLVLHGIERIDTLTARTLSSIARESSDTLGIVVLHETRWETPLCLRTLTALKASGGTVVRVPALTESTAAEIVTSLCPSMPPTEPVEASTPQAACEIGWQRLAAWRGEVFHPNVDGLAPLAVRAAPLPSLTARRILPPSAFSSPWVKVEDDRVQLHGRTALELVRTRLADLGQPARETAIALGDTVSEADHDELAAFWLLAGEPASAWAPAARAAIEAERRGVYAKARRLLLLLDTLPVPPDSKVREDHSRFQVAFVQARVALRTDVAVRTTLVEFCEHLAADEEERLLARVLRAEYALREGALRPALVSSLRVASAPDAQVTTRIRALMVAIHCRLMLGQTRDALRALRRVEELLSPQGDPLDKVRVLRWKTEIAYTSRKLDVTRKLAMATIRRAHQLGYTRGVAFASSRLGMVLRQLGHRRQAETYTRSAREASQATGDVYLSAETGLALATLLAERGETAGARQVLDQTVHQIRALRLDHLLASAMRVALLLAALQGSTAEAQVALQTLQSLETADPEVPATLVRWWRHQSDVDRALEVEAPPADTYGHTLFLLERARAAVSGRYEDIARDQARAGLQEATQSEYGELRVYARLILGAVEQVEDRPWDALLQTASQTLNTETYLGALEMHARRLTRQGNEAEAKRQWRSLGARSEELGYRPGMEEAFFWLSDGELTYTNMARPKLT